MSIKKITDAEALKTGVRSLPDHPSGNSMYGQGSYSAEQLKTAFDALPNLIRERYNELADSINNSTNPNTGILKQIKTGISDGHTLYDLVNDIVDGQFATYMNAGGNSLTGTLSYISGMVTNAVIGITYNGSGGLSVYTTYGSFDVSLDEFKKTIKAEILAEINGGQS